MNQNEFGCFPSKGVAKVLPAGDSSGVVAMRVSAGG